MVMKTTKSKCRVTASAAREELGREMKHLRTAVREAGETFILRREGEIETIIGHLEAMPATSLKTKAPGWLHGIRDLKLKPAKGRLKDLKALDGLIEELADQVMTAQDGKKGTDRARKAR